jgi:hypothetical protein
MFRRHIADDLGHERLARDDEIVKRYRLIRHAIEAAREFLADIFLRRAQNFRHRPIMAEEVYDEGRAQIVADAFVPQQIADIEQIARMLAIEGGDDLSGVEIGRRDHLDFGESEFVFDLAGHAASFWGKGAATQYRRHFDLDLDAVGAHEKRGHRAIMSMQIDPRAADGRFDLRRYPFRRRIDRRKGLVARMDGQICQIDIDRKARHIADEQIDRRAAFQREAVFRRDQRDRPDEQGDLAAIDIGERHQKPFGTVIRKV